MTKGKSTWIFETKCFSLCSKGGNLIYSHFPIQYQSQDKLQSWKKASQKEREMMSLPIQISCSGCRFSQLCTSKKPCKDYAFSPYLPQKILDAFSGYHLEVKCWTAIRKRKSLRIQLSDGESLSFSIGLFINGREIADNLLQVLLRRFTKRFQHFNFCKQKVIRWRF